MTTEKTDWRSGQIEEMRAQAQSLRKEAETHNHEASVLEARIRDLEQERDAEDAKDSVRTLAIMCANCQEEYEAVFQKHMYRFKTMEADEFWPILDKFATKVEYWNGGNCNPIKRAADNVLWDILDKDNWSMDSWERCARFVVAYDDISVKLRNHCHDMKGVEKSDDGYCDWTDGLPLAGRKVVEGILSDDIATYKQVEAAITEHRKGLVDTIQDGENYVRGALDEVLRNFFVNVVRQASEKSDEEQL